jgi:hypothetical protein
VAAEVDHAARLGFRQAEFVDSVFNVPEEHAIACCESISRLRSRVQLQTLELNPLGCSPELVAALRAAGFVAVGCTAESGSDTVLESLRKGFTSDTLRKAAREMKKLDALKMWIFMLGGPGETESTVRETAQFMEQSLSDRDLVYVSCGVRILPGTDLRARAVAEGVISPCDDLLEPTFYFPKEITPDRALGIIMGSSFPSANILSLSDGNGRLLPLAQWLGHRLGLSPPYWRLAPVWNKIRRPWLSGWVKGKC